MSEELPTITTTPQPKLVPEGYASWNDYWTKAHNQPWRTEPEIDEERQKYLTKRRAVRPDIEKGIYPFKDIEPKLTRADVEWLLVTHESNGIQGPVIWSDGSQRQRTGLDLRGAHLAETNLRSLPLARLHGGLAFEERLSATSEQTEMAAMHLEGADLIYAHLEGAWLWGAHLEGAICRNAHLEGAILDEAHLAGANLREVFLDAGTTLVNVSLSNGKLGEVSLVDLRWDGVNLALVNWTQLKMLGNERRARSGRYSDGRHKESSVRLYDFELATRASLQLTNVLRSQGISEHADRFAYRAQLLQRQVFRRQHKFGSYLFSLVLALLAGYGYRLGRILVAYALIVVVFAAAFLASGLLMAQTPLTVQHALDALQISLNAIHGRVFFAQFHLDTLQSWLATGESILGIVIEGVFVAMLIQRFFAR